MANRPRKKRSRNSPQKSKQAESKVITGTLRVHPRGFGFVVPEDATQSAQDIFIPKHLTDNAVDGDLVEVAINPDSNWDKGPDGKIVSILNRGRTHLAGIITHLNDTILAHVPILGAIKPIIVKATKPHQLQLGDRLIFKVLEWGNEQTPTICEVSHKIGNINEPFCDVAASVEEYGLRSSFPEKAIKEAQAFGEEVSKKELKNRLDLTETVCITIDPETAKDFDDALSISKDEKGNFFVGVHIADVAHYVPPGSALDEEAAKRCNSTYFPGTCVPMLPEELSNNLCSLKQGVIRLCVSVLIEFSPDGTVKNSQVKRTFIKSRKRLTYGEAKEILDGKKRSPHTAMLKQMVELCLLLKKKRSERGSIDFALPDLIIVIDKKGEPTGIRIEEYDITHQLVEEFMLKANELVAKHLDNQDKSLLFRIHEEPSSENMEDFFATARSLGFKVPPKATQQDLQNLFEQARHTPFSQQLSVGFIRSLKIAYYSSQNVGHYGLALEHYCHFTSPIRRYSDLIIERLLFNEEGKGVELDPIAQRCSEQERVSFRAEMSVKSLKKLRLLKKWLEEDPSKEYSAFITRIKPFGLFFEMRTLFLEGFLHISELENDYFIYDSAVPMLVGESTGKKHVVGEEIAVRPISVDLIHLDSKWELVSNTKRKRWKK